MKNTFLNETSLSQIDRRIEALRTTKELASIRGGWIKYMRQALGLTLQDLAKKVALTPANIAQAEKREVEEKVSIVTLKKLAEAMECELVYFFVPKKDIRSFIHDKAVEKARKTLGIADLHMRLEEQIVLGDDNDRVERLARKFIDKGDIW